MQIAAQYGKLNIVKLFVAMGGSHHGFAMITAANNGNINIIDYLYAVTGAHMDVAIVATSAAGYGDLAIDLYDKYNIPELSFGLYRHIVCVGDLKLFSLLNNDNKLKFNLGDMRDVMMDAITHKHSKLAYYIVNQMRDTDFDVGETRSDIISLIGTITQPLISPIYLRPPCTDIDTKMINAASINDHITMQQCFDIGVTLLYKREAMCMLAVNGYLHGIKKLDHGCNLSICASAAAQNGHIHIVKYCIEQEQFCADELLEWAIIKRNQKLLELVIKSSIVDVVLHEYHSETMPEFIHIQSLAWRMRNCNDLTMMDYVLCNIVMAPEMLAIGSASDGNVRLLEYIIFNYNVWHIRLNILTNAIESASYNAVAYMLDLMKISLHDIEDIIVDNTCNRCVNIACKHHVILYNTTV
jgi:hypothetical protein